MSANDINTDFPISEYVLKLLPDLTVFDLVEEYFINTKKENGFYTLFFYYDNTLFNEDIFADATINFRRFIIRYDGEAIGISASSDKNDFLTYDFSVGEWNYKVIIDENLVSGGFKININTEEDTNTNIIGVCF